MPSVSFKLIDGSFLNKSVILVYPCGKSFPSLRSNDEKDILFETVDIPSVDRSSELYL